MGLGRGEARSEWSSKGRSRVQKWYTREQAARDSLEKCALPCPQPTPRAPPLYASVRCSGLDKPGLMSLSGLCRVWLTSRVHS